MDNLKVYKLNDSEWYITPWSIDKTLAWYNKEFKCNLTTDMIQECNVYKEGMWLETTDEDDIEALGDSDEIISIIKTPQGLKRSVMFGDLMKKGESVYKYCSFKVAIEEIYDEELKEPEIIASTEF